MTEPSGGGGQTSLEEDLAAWGKVVNLETRGRRSGRPRRVTVGFVEEASDTLLVAAADEHVHWALNLLADPRCVVERDGERRSCRAVPLGEPERRAAVAALIMRYGAPAERLGAGPAFRLIPDPAPDADLDARQDAAHGDDPASHSP
jgi:deazaflavin-dependent oxidoreductase (nitroreductase family)